jgi:hypothetical protein
MAELRHLQYDCLVQCIDDTTNDFNVSGSSARIQVGAAAHGPFRRDAAARRDASAAPAGEGQRVRKRRPRLLRVRLHRTGVDQA